MYKSIFFLIHYEYDSNPEPESDNLLFRNVTWIGYILFRILNQYNDIQL